LEPGVHDRIREALAALSDRFELVDVDVPELELADGALGAIVLREAWLVHRELFEREADRYGPGTRALLEAGSRVTHDEYRRGPRHRARERGGTGPRAARAPFLAGRAVPYPAPPEAPPVGTPEGDLEARFPGPYTLAGVPAVSVPCGLAEGSLPAGLQLAAA